MAEKEVLSQEEIDALLESVDEVAEDEAQEFVSVNPDATNFNNSEMVDTEGVKIVNFTNQERIVKGKLPVLVKIYDRTIRLFTTDLYHITAKDFIIKQEPLAFIKYRDFMSGLANPSLMSLYQFKPLRGKALIIFDKIFVYDLVDYYFGGSSQFFSQKDKEEFTATEMRVMDLVVSKLVHAFTQAWEAIMHLEPVKLHNEESNPQLIHFGEPEEMLLVSRFSLDFGKEVGSFTFALPYSMLEPIKQRLEFGASRPDDEIDPNWIDSLKVELMDIELTVGAVMAQTKSSLKHIIAWQIDDFIALEMDDTVILDIEGQASFTAALGSSNDKRALQIIKKIGG